MSGLLATCCCTGLDCIWLVLLCCSGILFLASRWRVMLRCIAMVCCWVHRCPPGGATAALSGETSGGS